MARCVADDDDPFPPAPRGRGRAPGSFPRGVRRARLGRGAGPAREGSGGGQAPETDTPRSGLPPGSPRLSRPAPEFLPRPPAPLRPRPGGGGRTGESQRENESESERGRKREREKKALRMCCGPQTHAQPLPLPLGYPEASDAVFLPKPLSFGPPPISLPLGGGTPHSKQPSPFLPFFPRSSPPPLRPPAAPPPPPERFPSETAPLHRLLSPPRPL